MIDQKTFTTRRRWNSSVQQRPVISNRAVRRALRDSLRTVREAKWEAFQDRNRSATALRLDAVHNELARIAQGDPVRSDFLVRAMGSLPIIPPICNHQKDPMEVLAP